MQKPGEVLMGELLGVRPKKGEVGIEIELEGQGLGAINGSNFWNVEHDGSLRGESIEMVLKTPALRHLVPARLVQFLHMIKGCDIYDSGRAGIHIHINIQDMTPREYVQFLVMYMIFEDTLVEFCGDGRVGNLFCLRTTDAGAGIRHIRTCIERWRWTHLGTDDIRYSSVNLKATATYGSLEFRAMRSTCDVLVIQKWIDILCTLKDKARKFESPAEIVEQLSILGTKEFFDEVLGKYDLPFDRNNLMQGVRNAQLIAYCRETWVQEKVQLSTGLGGEKLIDRLIAEGGMGINHGRIGMHQAGPQFIINPDQFIINPEVIGNEPIRAMGREEREKLLQAAKNNLMRRVLGE